MKIKFWALININTHKNVQINNINNLNKTDNRVKNDRDHHVISNDSSNLEIKKQSQNPTSYNDVESSDFLFTSEQQKESSKKHDSLDPIDSDVLFDDLSKISQKKLIKNDKGNPNSFTCTLDDDESLIDDISDDQDLSIIPKVDSGSLPPNQRSEIALEDLEDILNEEEDKNEKINNNIKNVKKFDESKSFDQFDRNSSSLISTSQINGDNAFGKVKQFKNGSENDVEGIIEPPSDFDFWRWKKKILLFYNK